MFNTAIKAIKAAIAQGHRVCTNTTIYKETDPQEIEILFSYLGHIGVYGLLVSPAYSFESVDKDLYLSREEIKDKFNRLTGNGQGFKFFSTPLYLSFLRGERDYDCTPWANPTRNPHGWRSPCYQIVDTHYASFKELMARTKWESYGVDKDPRCAQCMMHSGFEPTAVRELHGFADMWTMFRWNLT
jgi:hopanoid biosynthesis associated radical SAM protein HpnH